MKLRKSTNKKSNSKKSSNKLVDWVRSHRLVVPIAFIIVFGGIGVWQLTGSKASTITSINNASMSDVNAEYWAKWGGNVGITSNWNGSISGCKAGSISTSAVYAQVQAVNFARRLNDLEPIQPAVLDGPNQAKAQKAALMMAANNALSHDPPTSWKCYTSDGATAAGYSDLALAYPSIKPTQAVELYMDDKGDSNVGVGHRRWLLEPDRKVLAFGMTDTSSALTVIGLPTDSTNYDPVWVTWPSKGYFPTPIEPGGRWSASTHAGAYLSKATVTVTHNGVKQAITLYPLHTGYGRPTLVWQMPSGFPLTGKYIVTIHGAHNSAGETMADYTYGVNFFDPYK